MAVVQLRGRAEPKKIKTEKREQHTVQLHGLIKEKKSMPAMVNRGGVVQLRNNTWKWFIRKGAINNNTLIGNSYAGIHGAWKDQPCYVIGGGPALKEFLDICGWSFLDGRHTIGINHTIEDYDGFEWFFFLDKRFLDRTTYKLDRFAGRIFAQSTTGLQPDNRIVTFFGNVNGPQVRIQNGLFSPNLSGLAALNLAVLTGANPIYLLGMGNGKGATDSNYHYKHDYTGEPKNDGRLEKYIRSYNGFDKFAQWNDRIVHVTEGSDIECFRKMRIAEFKDRHGRIEVKSRVPKIVHFSFCSDVAKHADITRAVIEQGYGKHELCDINKPDIPVADLYVMEDFMSITHKINAFPYKNKAINIVHSNNCIPAPGFKVNLSLTTAWKKYFLDKYFVKNVEVIHGGIDLEPYKSLESNIYKKTFGRITRWSKAKIHQDWNRICKELLDEIPESESLFYIDDSGGREKLIHDRMRYDTSCKIDMFKGAFLKNLSVYVHASGGFKETLSFALIEAMATGLPIVYLTEGTGVLEEVTDTAGIRCENIEQVKDAIKRLLLDVDMRKEYRARSLARAKHFDLTTYIKRFDALIKRCLCR